MRKWIRSATDSPAVVIFLVWMFLGPLIANGLAAVSCSDMAAFSLTGGTITSALFVEPGRFAPPEGARPSQNVQTPRRDSQI
jgi:hypothetical protein